MVVDTLKKILSIPPQSMQSEKTKECIHFTKEMEKVGLIKYTHPATNSSENKFEQLKLLSTTHLPKR